jgi:hypothetical protein
MHKHHLQLVDARVFGAGVSIGNNDRNISAPVQNQKCFSACPDRTAHLLSARHTRTSPVVAPAPSVLRLPVQRYLLPLAASCHQYQHPV